MFVNRYHADENMINEFTRNILSKKIISQASFVLTLSFAFAIFSFMRKSTMLLWVYIAVIALALAAIIFMPKKIKKNFVSSDKAYFNGKADETVITFDDDKITVREDDSTMEFTYDQIEKIHFFNYICVLMVSKHNGIVVSREGFGDQDVQEFAKFIKEKCVNKNKQDLDERKSKKHKTKKDKAAIAKAEEEMEMAREAAAAKEEEKKEELPSETKEEENIPLENEEEKEEN